MLLGVLLILPLYAMVLGIFWRFRRLIKAMTEIEEIFADCSAEEETFQEEPSKQEFLIAQVDIGKADRLPGKTPWTVKRLRKATDLVIEKLHHEYFQADVRHKNEATRKAVGTHVITMYSKGVSRVLRIDNDPIIRDSMADVGALMVGTFGRFLALCVTRRSST